MQIDRRRKKQAGILHFAFFTKCLADSVNEVWVERGAHACRTWEA